MVEKEFKLRRKIFVGSRIHKAPLPKPLPEEKEHQKKPSKTIQYSAQNAEELRETASGSFDRKDLLQGARRFILETRAEGARDIGNVVGDFARWNIEQRDLLSHVPDFSKVDNLVEQMRVMEEWEMKLFNAQIRVMDAGRNVLKQLHKSNLYQFDNRIFDEMPTWAQIPYVDSLKEYGDYSETDDEMQPFVILDEFAKEYAESSLEDMASYEVMSKLLQLLLRDTRAQEMAIFIKSLLMIESESFEKIYKKYFKEDKSKPVVKRMYKLFSNFLLQTYQALMDVEDPRHAESRAFLTDFIHSPVALGSIDERIQIFTVGAIKRGVKSQLDEVTLIKNLYSLAETSKDAWYAELAKRMKSVVELASLVMVYDSDRLQTYFEGEKEWSDQNWSEIEHICQELSLTNKWVHLAKKEDMKLAVPLEFVTARLKKDGDILFGQLFFVHNKGLLEYMSKTHNFNEIPFALVTFAIDLQPEHQAIYLRLIDEDSVDESLQAHMLSVTHELLSNTLRIKKEKAYTPTETENMLTHIQAYDIAPVKEKGLAFTPRAKHKRPRTLQSRQKDGTLIKTAKSFAEEIQEKRLWPKFVMTEETIAELREKFNDSDINRIQQKLAQANHGAGVVKTYPEFEGPRENQTIWAIRLNKQVRILAQEGVEKGQAHVFSVEFKSEIEKK